MGFFLLVILGIPLLIWLGVSRTNDKNKRNGNEDRYQFYNTSKFTFETLLSDPENIEANFRDYLAGFSGNVQDVLSKFDFDTVIRRMVKSNTLYLTIDALIRNKERVITELNSYKKSIIYEYVTGKKEVPA